MWGAVVAGWRWTEDEVPSPVPAAAPVLGGVIVSEHIKACPLTNTQGREREDGLA